MKTAFSEKASAWIEWAKLITEIIPDTAIWITIEKDPEKGMDYRKITIH